MDEKYKVVHSDDLTPEQREYLGIRTSYDRCWAVVDDRGELIGADGGEPEDQLLVRDWSWVVEALNAAYARGRRDCAELVNEAQVELPQENDDE